MYVCVFNLGFSVLFCYDKNFMLSIPHINQANIIEAFTSSSRHLDDLTKVIMNILTKNLIQFIQKNYN